MRELLRQGPLMPYALPPADLVRAVLDQPTLCLARRQARAGAAKFSQQQVGPLLRINWGSCFHSAAIPVIRVQRTSLNAPRQIG